MLYSQKFKNLPTEVRTYSADSLLCWLVRSIRTENQSAVLKLQLPNITLHYIILHRSNSGWSGFVLNFSGYKYPSLITFFFTYPTHRFTVDLKGNNGINYLQNFLVGLFSFESNKIFIMYCYLYLFTVKVNYSTKLPLN